MGTVACLAASVPCVFLNNKMQGLFFFFSALCNNGSNESSDDEMVVLVPPGSHPATMKGSTLRQIWHEAVRTEDGRNLDL